MDPALNSIEGNGVVGCIRCENSDGIARGERINCGFISISIPNIIGWIRVKGGVEVIVDLGNVLMKMLSCLELASVIPRVGIRDIFTDSREFAS